MRIPAIWMAPGDQFPGKGTVAVSIVAFLDIDQAVVIDSAGQIFIAERPQLRVDHKLWALQS